MPTIYRIIARDDNKVVQYRDPDNAATFLIGRRVSAYIIVKSDDLGDRIVVMPAHRVARSGIDFDRVKEAMRSQ